jgi:hypothetical protein
MLLNVLFRYQFVLRFFINIDTAKSDVMGELYFKISISSDFGMSFYDSRRKANMNIVEKDS